MLSQYSIQALLQFLQTAPQQPFSTLIPKLVQNHFSQEEYSSLFISLKMLMDDHFIQSFSQRIVSYWVLDYVGERQAQTLYAATSLQQQHHAARSSSQNIAQQLIPLNILVLHDEIVRMDQFAFRFMSEQQQLRRQAASTTAMSAQQAQFLNNQEEQVKFNVRYKLFILKLLLKKHQEFFNICALDFERMPLRQVQIELESLLRSPECIQVLQKLGTDRLTQATASPLGLPQKSPSISPFVSFVSDNPQWQPSESAETSKAYRALHSRRFEPLFARPLPPMLHDETNGKAQQGSLKSFPLALDDMCWIDTAALDVAYNGGLPLEPLWLHQSGVPPEFELDESANKNLSPAPVPSTSTAGQAAFASQAASKADEQALALFSKCLKQQLVPSDQDSLIKYLRTIERDKFSETFFAMMSVLTPQNLADVAQHNHNVVAELLIMLAERAEYFPHSTIDEYSLALASMSLSVSSMEIILKLLQRQKDQPLQQGEPIIYFPKHCLHLYIANAISNIEKSFDGNGAAGSSSAGNSRMMAAKTRMIRLICVFLQKLIRNNMWNSTVDEDEEDILSRVEVKHFLTRNLKHADAQQLFQQLFG